jgi:hypothetical protein
MTLPFTIEQFFEVFAAYNQAVWPAQVALMILGVALPVLSFLPRLPAPRLIPWTLAVLWAWMGVVYHLGFFRGINPLATVFGVAFLLAAGLFGAWSRFRPPTSFRPAYTPRAWVGGVLLLYALVIYPQLATTFGHLYPGRPTFGLPCPTAIATLGILLWATPRPPWWVWAGPLGWSVVGASAAFTLGVREDLGLAGAAIAVLLHHWLPEPALGPRASA